MEQYKISSSPVAEQGAVVQGAKYRFTVLFNGLVRYEWAEDGHFEDRPSVFAVNRRFPVPEYKVLETDDVLEIVTDKFHLVFAKSLDCFSPNSLTVQVKGAIAQWGTIWRFGIEDPFQANLGGTARTLDGANGAIPLEDGVLSRRGYSEINDTTSMLLESNGWVAPRRPGPNRHDGYVFAYGLDYRAAIKALYSVSGPQPALPRWALGNWWSRFYAYTQDSYTKLMDDFAEDKVPLSVAVIDMDWHLVNKDPKVIASGSTGWTGYTWDKNLFPDPPKFLKALHDKYKLKVTLNDHPADGVYNYEDSYKDMANALGHDTSHGTPIHFDPTSPQFFKEFFQILHRRLENEGIDFWWVDWQQGPYSRVPGIDPLWLLNHYHFLDNKLFPPPYCPSAAERPMIFSRYAGPGSHRYPLGFSGDSVTTWESLDFQPYFTSTASNIGYGWWSHDIGGHMLGARDDELVTRWVQLGCLSPVLRLHSSDSPWSGKEPWSYGEEAHQVMSTWLRFRHRLLPYIGSVNFAIGQEGETQAWPIVQPMYWDYPDNNAAYECKNQFFFGTTSTIIAPITSPVNPKSKLAKVKAWIPPSANQNEPSAKWVDIFTSSVYEPDKEVVLYRPLSQNPVLAKEGSIIPLDGAEVPANGCENPTSFELLLVVGRDAEFTILEEEVDDPDQKSTDVSKTGQLRSIPIKWTQSSSKLTIGPTTGSSSTSPSTKRSFSIRILGVTSLSESDISVSHDLTPSLSTIIPKPEISASKPSSSLFTGAATLITLPAISFPFSSPLTITLSSKPLALDTPSPLPSIFQYIHTSQLDFGLKSKLWDIANDSSLSATGKMARLMAIDAGEKRIVKTSTGPRIDGGLEGIEREDVLGPVFEALGGCA